MKPQKPKQNTETLTGALSPTGVTGKVRQIAQKNVSKLPIIKSFPKRVKKSA